MNGLSTDPWKKLSLVKKDIKILVVGLSKAGKTSILKKINVDDSLKTIPNNDLIVKTLQFKNTLFTSVDIGGQNFNTDLLKQYYQNINGLIFVLDSCDTQSFDDVKLQLNNLLAIEELKEVPLLVIANKQDIEGATSPNYMCENFGLVFLRGRSWLVQTTSAKTGEGIDVGLDWMAEKILNKLTSSILSFFNF
jgi:small GTP-binding protein